MSYAAAISAVSQILELQQQLLDPTQAAGSTSATDSTGTSSSATGSVSDSEFAAELEQALASADSGEGSSDEDSSLSGTDTSDLLSSSDSSTLASLLASLESSTSGSSASGSTTGTAAATTAADGTGAVTAADTTYSSASAQSKVSAMIAKADSLLGDPYVWGGGHSGWGTQSGYDCSGFVSAVLHAGGYLSTPQDTETLASASGIDSGAGKYVTIYDRDASGQEGHVIIDIDGQFYESGGEHGSWGGGGGVEKIATPSAAYLSTFNEVLHPDGL